MDWQLIESDEALQRVLVQGAGSEAVIVDTEFMRRNTFYPQVALVQICFAREGVGGNTAWLIDPLTIEDTAPLVALFTDPAVVKVLHSASEDMEVFQKWLGVLPQPLFDTQRAAAMVGRGFGLGYRALVHAICDIDLPKGETRSDWLQRPLSESQCEYAALDVAWLLPVWRELDEQCAQQGKRDWVLADGRDAMGALGAAVIDYHKRIKTAWKLNPRQLGSLAAICDWREQTARSRDKPRSWIIDDKACLTLAQEDPQNWSELKTRVDLPPPALRRYGEGLLDVLAAQRTMPEDELPQALPGPLDAGQRDQVKKLKARVRVIAQGLALAPEILLQSKDYELLLREAAGAAFSAPVHWQGWRNDIVIGPLRRSLTGAMQ
ncbi:MAG: ribonuclease D [Gammaproteobacteria bacterium]|nr:MAG: ribonuclease D [Gammaproteobacteria bacterium]